MATKQKDPAGSFFVRLHTQNETKKIYKMTCLPQNFEYNRL